MVIVAQCWSICERTDEGAWIANPCTNPRERHQSVRPLTVLEKALETQQRVSEYFQKMPETLPPKDFWVGYAKKKPDSESAGQNVSFSASQGDSIP